MASRTRKTALAETVAVVETAQPMSNYIPLPETDHVLAVAKYSFTQKDHADTANGKATQSMAYACMALWTLWRADRAPGDGNTPVPDLVSILHVAGKGHKETLKGWFIEAILGEKPDIADAQNDSGAAIALDWNKKTQLISRGMSMGAILMASGVTHDMFNDKEHAFAVPVSLLLMPGWIVIPGSRAADDKNHIILNRRSYGALSESAQGKPTLVKFVASVDQLNKASRARMKLQPARAPRTATPLEKTEPELLASKIPLSNLVRALHKAFVTLSGHVKAQPDSMTPEVWSMLSDIAQESDAIQKSEAFAAYVQYRSSAGPMIEGTVTEVSDAA